MQFQIIMAEEFIKAGCSDLKNKYLCVCALPKLFMAMFYDGSAFWWKEKEVFLGHLNKYGAKSYPEELDTYRSISVDAQKTIIFIFNGCFRSIKVLLPPNFILRKLCRNVNNRADISIGNRTARTVFAFFGLNKT